MPSSSFKIRPCPEEGFSGSLCHEWKHLQAAWVLLEAVDTSAQRPPLRGPGWEEGGLAGRVGALVRQGAS